MTTAEHAWLDLRVPYDNAARQSSLRLLQMAASTLGSTSPAEPVTIIDVGAGTGNSARWFSQHLEPLLTDRDLRWVLVDTDEAALETAACTMPEAETVVAPIVDLPQITDTLHSAHAGQLLVVGSAVLDVFTAADLEAMSATIRRHAGLGLFFLSITGDWQLDPADPDDVVMNRAFIAHQQREGKLGPDGPELLRATAQRAGAVVESGTSPWVMSAPRDAEMLLEFLTARVEAAIEQQPSLHGLATEWLDRRRAQLAKDLTVEVDHLDLFIDGRAAQSAMN